MDHASSHEPTVKEIVDVLGREAIMARLDIKKSAISQACIAGRFPSSWFAVISDMCAEAGIECRRSLFSFKGDVPALVVTA